MSVSCPEFSFVLCPTQHVLYMAEMLSVCRSKVVQYMQFKTKYNKQVRSVLVCLILSFSTQLSCVLSICPLCICRAINSRLSKILVSYFSLLLLSLRSIAEAHSAVLLLLPLSCWLCRRAKLCRKTPFARDPAALQPVLSAVQPLDLLPSH